MNEDMIFDEIRSVFKGPMNDNKEFPFAVLQPMGGSSKCLAIPSLSSSFRWTASAIVPKNAKSPLYILAKESLVEVSTNTWDVPWHYHFDNMQCSFLYRYLTVMKK